MLIWKTTQRSLYLQPTPLYNTTTPKPAEPKGPKQVQTSQVLRVTNTTFTVRKASFSPTTKQHARWTCLLVTCSLATPVCCPESPRWKRSSRKVSWQKQLCIVMHQSWASPAQKRANHSDSEEGYHQTCKIPAIPLIGYSSIFLYPLSVGAIIHVICLSENHHTIVDSKPKAAQNVNPHAMIAEPPSLQSNSSPPQSQ